MGSTKVENMKNGRKEIFVTVAQTRNNNIIMCRENYFFFTDENILI